MITPRDETASPPASSTGPSHPTPSRRHPVRSKVRPERMSDLMHFSWRRLPIASAASRFAAILVLFTTLTVVMTWPQARYVATHASDHWDVYFKCGGSAGLRMHWHPLHRDLREFLEK